MSTRIAPCTRKTPTKRSPARNILLSLMGLAVWIGMVSAMAPQTFGQPYKIYDAGTIVGYLRNPVDAELPLRNRTPMRPAMSMNFFGQFVSTSITGNPSYLWLPAPAYGFSAGYHFLPQGFIPYALNNFGQVAGIMAADRSVAVWTNRVLRNLGKLPGYDTIINVDMNFRGVIVGTAATLKGGSSFDSAAFIAGPGDTQLRKLFPDLPGSTAVSHLNSSADVVGLQFPTGTLPRVLITRGGNTTGPGSIQVIESLDVPGHVTLPEFINNWGDVAGVRLLTSALGGIIDDSSKIFTYAPAAVTDLPSNVAVLDVGSPAEVFALNARAQVLLNINFTNYVYQSGTLNRLEQLIPANSGWTDLLGGHGLLGADANDNGWIIGAGTYRGQFDHAFLMIPAGLDATAAVAPTEVALGRPVTYTLTLSNSTAVVTPITLSQVRALLLPSDDVGLATFVSGPDPASVGELPPGQIARFTYTLRSALAGRTRLFSQGASFNPKAPTLSFTNLFSEYVFATLTNFDFTTSLRVEPGRVELDDSFNVILAVRNASPQPLASVAPAGALVWDGTGDAVLVQNPAPAQVATLAAGATVEFKYAFKAKREGGIVFKGHAIGTTPNGTLLETAETASDALRIGPIGDLLIKRGDEDATQFGLDHVYQTVPDGAQIRTNSLQTGETAAFQVLVQNNSKTAQSFTLKAVETVDPGWSVNYLAGSDDISAAVRTTNGWTVPQLDSGKAVTVVLQMTPTPSARQRRFEAQLLLRPVLDATDLLDSVKAIGLLPVPALAVDTDKNRAFLGEKFVVTVTFANTNTQVLANVSPGNLTILSDPVKSGKADVVQGPIPASVDVLAPGATTNFVYEYRASKVGKAAIQAQVHGTLPGGIRFDSELAQSDPLEFGTVTVVDIEPVQSVYLGPMVADKPTLARVTLENTFDDSLPVTLRLAVRAGETTEFANTNQLEVAHGVSQFLLPKTDPDPARSFFKLRSDSQLEATVNPDAQDDYPRKQFSLTIPVEVVRPLKVGYVQLIMDGACNVNMPAAGEELRPSNVEIRDYARRTHSFVEAMFPIPRIKGDGTVLGIMAASSALPNSLVCAFQLRSLEMWLIALAKSSREDVMVGVLPESIKPIAPGSTKYSLTTFFEAINQGGAQAETFIYGVTGPGILLTTYSRLDFQDPTKPVATGPGILAHEIGHVYGLALPEHRLQGVEEYNDFVKPEIEGRPASDGVWIDPDRVWHTDSDRSQINVGLTAAGNPTYYNFMASSSVLPSAEGVWIAADDYSHLLRQFRAFRPDPEVVLIYGVISDQGLLSDDWFTLSSGQIDAPVPESPDRVVFRDASGRVLLDQGVETIPSHDIPPGSSSLDGAFAVTLPRFAETRTIQIVHNGTVLQERTVSAAGPTLDQLTWDAASTATAGSQLRLSWNSRKADGTAPTHLIRFSDDDGASWTALTPLRTNVFTWTVADVPTDFARLQILASDGVNATSLVTPRFKIVGSPGTVRARVGLEQSVLVGTPVHLDGSMSSGGATNALSYQWRIAGMPAGSAASLSTMNTPKTSFVADQTGRYLVELLVSDEQGHTDRAYASVISQGPLLQADWTGERLRLSWSASLAGFQLERTDTLGPAAIWSPAAEIPTVSGDTQFVLEPAQTAARFYRLRQP